MISRTYIGRLMLGGLLALTAHQAMADTTDLADKLVVNGKKMPVQSVASSPLPGINEVQLTSGETFYTDDQGHYLLVGDLYKNTDKGLVNLTKQKQANARQAMIDNVDEKNMVVFKPAGKVKHVITVFTDTTCPYCHKLHEDVPMLNKAGIEVRYLAFPRAGMNSKGAEELANVWCSANKTEAMTAAMNGDGKRGKSGCTSKVAQQYRLGQQVGVQGTPAIMLPNGELIAGYLPAERLIDMIDNS
ncbi:thioredoxin fold domain-containing protein [Larsenimonas suaedae]|uniref:Thiol:disulfide interchange protein n=1 Tax=Larsenimonas suaedae TaxID=1851019 RepID=A0ABU1GX02_9GAMM|nr:thioredoxin fold domain-containing protein [Larsenimonas suaedae]MCM2973144.1 thioredoxin fold domain-containing protein [Larsenimonas suaedae]MDR5896581.1 thioredoxin fold domain-containing protein [Larsenimonas suaedae]